MIDPEVQVELDKMWAEIKRIDGDELVSIVRRLQGTKTFYVSSASSLPTNIAATFINGLLVNVK